MLLIFTLPFAVRAVKSLGQLAPDVVGQICVNCPDQTIGILSQVSRRLNKDCEEEMMKRRQRILVDELKRLRRIARYYDHRMSPHYMLDASKEINHYLNGFDTRMHHGMSEFHSKYRDADRGVKREIEEFAINLAQHRTTYPRLPPHRRGDQEEMPLFDAFIKMKDDNTEIFRKRMRDDYIMFADRNTDLYWEREAIMEVMRVMETIGIVIDYPGVREMLQEESGNHGCSEQLLKDVRNVLRGTDDMFEWQCSPGTIMQILSWNSCIGDEETNKIVRNVQEFIEIWRAQITVKLRWF